jgi:hypothetical protein
MRISTKLIPLVFAAALAPAALADEHSEVVQAETHAGLAAAGTDVATVHTHLHHTLNCLVGPNGAGFDAKEMNPCANAGNGAIPDATDAAMKSKLEAAAKETEKGIDASELKAAQAAAKKTEAMLKRDEKSTMGKMGKM